MSAETANLDALRIHRNEPSKGRIPVLPILIVLIALAALAGWLYYSRKEEVPQVKVATAQASSGQAGRTVLNASGYVTARRRATVSAKTTGKVIEVLIEEGQKVEEGQILARLDDQNIRASYNLAAAQAKASHLAQAETRVALAEAKRVLARTQELIGQGFATPADLDRDRSAMDGLTARLTSEIQQEAVATQEIVVWKRQLEDTEVRAPFSGVVVSKDAQPGEMISPISAGGGFTRTGIGTIVDMASLEIEIDVNESYINRVSAGQEVVATLDAYSDWQIPAYVIAIVPTADRQKATVRVRIGFKELDPRILPEMGLKVAFRDAEPITESPTGVLIPASAIHRQDGKDLLFVVAAGALERRAVTLGDQKDQEVMILAGLRSGERVMIEGPAEPVDGMKVKEVSE